MLKLTDRQSSVGMLGMLISLSTANDAEVRQFAAYAVVRVAQNAEVRKTVTEDGGLEPVLYLARTDEPEIQRQVSCFVH